MTAPIPDHPDPYSDYYRGDDDPVIAAWSHAVIVATYALAVVTIVAAGAALRRLTFLIRKARP